jgi:hypothetical protein
MTVMLILFAALCALVASPCLAASSPIIPRLLDP